MVSGVHADELFSISQQTVTQTTPAYMMLVTSPFVLSLLLTPIIYAIYNVARFLLGARKMSDAIKQFPGEPTHWLWGHLHIFPAKADERLAHDRKMIRRYPKCSGFQIGPIFSMLQVRHPDTAKILLKSKEPKPKTSGVYAFGLPWIGDGLLLSEGDKWARNRRLLTPAFHFDVLKPYMNVNNVCADILLNELAKGAQNQNSVEIFSRISAYTFDVILRCAMSYVTDVQTKGERHPYLLSVSRLGELWTSRFFTPWQHFGLLYWLSKDGREFRKHCDYVHSVSEEVIRQRQRQITTETESDRAKRYLDFLDILLKARDEDGKGLPFEEIRDEVDTFMFEGHDTTASAISWILYALAAHPEYQSKCQDEIDAILDGRDSEHISWDDLAQLKYVTQCIKEGMRLYNPVPFVGRQLTKDTEIDGKILPKGSMIDIQIYSIHHNQTVWENDMEYLPSRFDPGKTDDMDSYAYVPFSAGPRNCIGQNFAMHEMKTAVARILRRFTLRVDPDVEVTMHPALVMRASEKGIRLRVTARM